jgi:hypothetical protein
MVTMCRSPKLWIAVGLAAIALAVASPNLGAVLPLLLVAACPVSMLLMMGGLAGMGRGKRNAATNGAAEGDDEVVALRAEVAELRDRVDR